MAAQFCDYTKDNGFYTFKWVNFVKLFFKQASRSPPKGDLIEMDRELSEGQILVDLEPEDLDTLASVCHVGCLCFCPLTTRAHASYRQRSVLKHHP